jgi:thiosulfate reductase cytochrome b subunit
MADGGVTIYCSGETARDGQYNALQKLAYTGMIGFGALSFATGLAMYQPVQLSAVAWLLGGYHSTRFYTSSRCAVS